MCGIFLIQIVSPSNRWVLLGPLLGLLLGPLLGPTIVRRRGLDTICIGGSPPPDNRGWLPTPKEPYDLNLSAVTWSKWSFRIPTAIVYESLIMRAWVWHSTHAIHSTHTTHTTHKTHTTHTTSVIHGSLIMRAWVPISVLHTYTGTHLWVPRNENSGQILYLGSFHPLGQPEKELQDTHVSWLCVCVCVCVCERERERERERKGHSLKSEEDMALLQIAWADPRMALLHV